MSPLFTSEEVAELLHIGVQTARRMMREGRIPAVRIGARWYAPASELEKVITRCGGGDHAQ